MFLNIDTIFCCCVFSKIAIFIMPSVVKQRAVSTESIKNPFLIQSTRNILEITTELSGFTLVKQKSL